MDLTEKEREYLAKAIKKGILSVPITKFALEASGKGALFQRLGALAGAPNDLALALLEQSGGGSAPARAGSAASAVQLLWSTPDVPQSNSKATVLALTESLAQAQSEVFVAGYTFDYGSTLFKPLHAAMVERGVNARILFDVPALETRGTSADAYLALRATQLLAKNWPFGEPRPTLYYYADALSPDVYRSVHAKCVVVDRKVVILGSANFTQRACKRNVEVGLRIQDPVLAESLLHNFEVLIANEVFRELATAALSKPKLPEEAEPEEEELGDAFEKRAVALLVSDEVRQLFLELLSDGFSEPLVGEDIEDNEGQIVGSPELAWPDSRVAVLLAEQHSGVAKLEASGWTCFVVPLDPRKIESLKEHLAREA